MPGNRTNEFLAHYGVKGMKWGVRRGKKKTGVSRAVGARIDTDRRNLQMYKDLRSGGKTTRHKLINVHNYMLMGKKRTQRRYDQEIRGLENRIERMTTGKATVMDKLSLIGNEPIMVLMERRS